MEKFIKKYRGWSVFIVPGFALYLYTEAVDVEGFALFTLAALVISMVMGLAAADDADKWQRLFYESCDQTERCQKMYKEKDQAYHQMKACCQYLLHQREVAEHEAVNLEFLDPFALAPNPPAPPYPTDVKLLNTHEEVLEVLGISSNVVDRMPIHPILDVHKTLEDRRIDRLHYIQKNVNYAIRAQGNEWVRKNRERMLKHLKLDEDSLAHPVRLIPDIVESIEDVLALLDVEKSDLSQSAYEELSVESIQDIIQREGKAWVRRNKTYLINDIEAWADF